MLATEVAAYATMRLCTSENVRDAVMVGGGIE